MKQRKITQLEKNEMSKADSESLQHEIIFRNDIELQTSILEAKKLKQKIENEKKLKLAHLGAKIVQKIFRGFMGRKLGRK